MEKHEVVVVKHDHTKCKFYPQPDEGCVCDRGSDMSGKFVCTQEYSKSCQWAKS